MGEFEESIRAHNLKKQVSIINEFGGDAIDPEFSKGHPVGYINKYGKQKQGDGSWKYVGGGKGTPKPASASNEAAPAPKESSTDSKKTAPAGKGSWDTFDFYDYATTISNRNEEYKRLIAEYNVGKSGDDKAWGHQNKEINHQLMAKAKEKYKSKNADLLRGGAKVEGTNTTISIPSWDSFVGRGTEAQQKAKAAAISRKVQQQMKLINTPGVKDILKKLEKAQAALEAQHPNMNGGAGTSISVGNLLSSNVSVDGKTGIVNASVRLGYANSDGSSAGFSIMVTPKGAEVVNLQDHTDKLAYDDFVNANKNAYAKVVKETHKALGEKSTVETVSFNAETKAKANSIISNRPSNSRYTTWQGSSIDNESGTVTLYVDTDREARHPDEYGAEGDRAEGIAHKYDVEMQNKVIKPLEKLGYRVNQQAK